MVSSSTILFLKLKYFVSLLRAQETLQDLVSASDIEAICINLNKKQRKIILKQGSTLI